MTARAARTPIRFGTDGWRAVIADGFTFANLERVAQAYSLYIRRQHEAPPDGAADETSAAAGTTAGGGARTVERNESAGQTRAGDDVKSADDTERRSAPLVVVGYDRRFLSDRFALRAAEVLSGNGVRVELFDSDVPTPLVSWAVRERGARGGIVITASHNPAEFNGFKIKAPWGGSATPETTAEVESLVDASETLFADAPAPSRGALEGSAASYREQIAACVDLGRLRAARGRVVVDPIHGTGGRWVESFLAGGELGVETIRAARDATFGGVAPEPIDRNLGPLKSRVRESGALVGLATDGDADRVGAVNELGETMTMHEVVPLLLLHLARARAQTGGVVRTFSQSVLTKRIAEAHGLRLHETPIGFKYVADLMLREDILVGAEESGGIGVKGHLPERDGILNSLLFLEAVVAAGRPPSEMVKEMHREFGAFYYDRRDLRTDVSRGLDLVARLAAAPPAEVAGHEVAGVERLDGTKLLFADESWLLFRQSGTEPVLRVYAEATSVEKRDALLAAGELLSRG